MNRETQRQIARLNRLVEFIEANPDQYNQVGAFTCVCGLGARLERGKLIPVSDFHEYPDIVFARRYGVSGDTARNINGGYFQKVNPRLDNTGNASTTKPSTAISLLNYIIKQKEKGVTP
jgi:hypothetical protein